MAKHEETSFGIPPEFSFLHALSYLPVTVLGLQGTQWPLPAPWQDILRWCAVNGVHLQALLPLPTV